MGRNRIVHRAIEADERGRRQPTGRSDRNNERRQRVGIVAKLFLSGRKPEVLAVAGRVSKIELIYFVAQPELDVEPVGRIPLILQRERREVRLDLVEEAR